MRPITLVIPVALLSLVTACGGATTPTATPTTPSVAAPTTSASPSADAGPVQVLTGTVGEEGKPEAFTITLADSTGAPVTTLKAGTYQVKVNDLAKFHNFNLNGEGVEQKTTVPEVTDATWTVTLKPGTYTYLCDPHPDTMKKTFTVT